MAGPSRSRLLGTTNCQAPWPAPRGAHSASLAVTRRSRPSQRGSCARCTRRASTRVRRPGTHSRRAAPGRRSSRSQPRPSSRARADRPPASRSTASLNACHRSSIRSCSASPPSSPEIAAASSARATGRSSGRYVAPLPQQRLQRLGRRQRAGGGDTAPEPAPLVLVARHREQQTRATPVVEVHELARDAGGGGDVLDGDAARPLVTRPLPGGLEDARASLPGELGGRHGVAS